jgi:HEAT repeat protein
MDSEQLTEKLEEVAKDPFSLPFDPQEVIKEALYHSDDEIRSKAINLAGSFDAEEFIEPLFHLIAEDENLEIRLAGLHCLGDYLHRGVMADYHRLADSVDEIPVKYEVEGLTVVQFQLIRDFLEKVVEQEDWPEKLRAEALLYYSRVAPELAVSSIERFYNTGETELVCGAVKAIARVETGDWRKIIMREIMREVSDPRRLAALEAAAVHDIYEAGPELVRILEEETDEACAKAAVETLGYISWPEAEEYLQQYARSNKSDISETAQVALRRRSSG